MGTTVTSLHKEHLIFWLLRVVDLDVSLLFADFVFWCAIFHISGNSKSQDQGLLTP
jgi:hypothetical protein